MSAEFRRSDIAVRLEGGIGDHVLGLRLLPFIRRRYPRHRITIFSDAAGSTAQLEVARMSPYPAEVHPVRQKPGAANYETMGRLENLAEDDLRLMLSGELFFDAWGATYFLAAARVLNVPYYQILAARTKLSISPAAMRAADSILRQYSDCKLVALHLAKFGGGFLQNAPMIHRMMEELLEQKDVVLLNLFQTSFDFTHWPAPIAEHRKTIALSDAEALERISQSHPRIIRLVDLPIAVVAAILSRCRYFVGVDNGVKHMAWALGLPLTFFMPEVPAGEFILRWVPDYHRLLVGDCSEQELEAHLQVAAAAIGAKEASR